MCSLYLQKKRYSFCITFTSMAYATNNTTVIVLFFHDRKLGPVCHKIGGRVRSSFLSGQWLPLRHITEPRQHQPIGPISGYVGTNIGPMSKSISERHRLYLVNVSRPIIYVGPISACTSATS